MERLALGVTIIKLTDLRPTVITFTRRPSGSHQQQQQQQQQPLNPYVKLQLLPEKRQKAKTRVVRRSPSPTYDESFTFYGIEADQLMKRSPSSSGPGSGSAAVTEKRTRRSSGSGSGAVGSGLTLHLAVLNFDSFGRDDLIGEVLFPLNEVDLINRAKRPLIVSRALISRSSNKVGLLVFFIHLFFNSH